MTGVLAALESASRQVLTKPVDDPLAGLCLAKEGGVVLGVDGFDGFTAWDRLLDSVPNLPCFFLFLCSPVGEAQKLELRDYYNRLNHFYGDFRSIQIVTGKGTQQVIKHPLAQVEQLLKQVKMKEQSLIRPGNGDGLFQVTMWYGADTKQHAKQAGEHLAAFSRWSRELLSDREQRICALDRGIGVDREDRSVWVPWASWYENGPRGLNNLANLMTLDHVAAMLVPPQEQRPGFYVRST